MNHWLSIGIFGLICASVGATLGFVFGRGTLISTSARGAVRFIRAPVTKIFCRIDGRREKGRMTDESFVFLSGAEFDGLPEFSHTLPTGTAIGRRWKCQRPAPPWPAPEGRNWYMGEYTRELPVPTCCRYHRCIAGVVDKEPCHRVQTAEGVAYDPEHPEKWPERPNRQVEIKWYRIICKDRRIFEPPRVVSLPTHLL